MTEKECVKHLKDQLLHGLKPDICNVLHYMYDTPDLQYSQLVMAARKAKTKTPGSNVSEARAKSAAVGTDSKFKGASSDPSYEAITQQIEYLMSANTNQNTNNNSARHNNGNGKIPNTKTQRSEKDRKDRISWGCGSIRHGWRECATPRQSNNLPVKPETSSPLPTSTREESTSTDN